jgi:putative FmdB family regulatory protein
MPLYEYQCEACGHRFEVIQKFSDAPIETCQRCSGVVRKLLSSPAIQFKGSGWYITDYARAGKSGDSGQPSGSEPPKSDSGSATESKSESKSEAKTDATTAAKASTTAAKASTSD